MALLGRLTKESYLKTRPRRRRSRNRMAYEHRHKERQRITKVEQWVGKDTYEVILSVMYVEGTRKPSLLTIQKNKRHAAIMLMEDGTYIYDQLDDPSATPVKVTNVRLNQRTGRLNWNELLDDGTVGPEQECSIRDELSVGLLLLAFPIGWFILANRAQVKSIKKSWESILDAAHDAYSER